jgi:hypothetical protein
LRANRCLSTPEGPVNTESKKIYALATTPFRRCFKKFGSAKEPL